MKIRFVTESHLSGDEKQTAEVVGEDEFGGVKDDIYRHLYKHDVKLRDHDRSFGDVSVAVRRHEDALQREDARLDAVAERVDRLPQTLRESLDRALDEVFADKLDCFAKQLETLRQERETAIGQLAELRRQQAEAMAQLDAVRGRIAEIEAAGQRLMDDCAMQVAEFRLSVPVPKKFAKFLFVQPNAAPGGKKD